MGWHLGGRTVHREAVRATRPASRGEKAGPAPSLPPGRVPARGPARYRVTRAAELGCPRLEPRPC